LIDREKPLRIVKQEDQITIEGISDVGNLLLFGRNFLWLEVVQRLSGNKEK